MFAPAILDFAPVMEAMQYWPFPFRWHLARKRIRTKIKNKMIINSHEVQDVI